MTASALKVHLTREHALSLLRHMVRIRRFEAKCAELYGAEKILGFLHLYDGEEAIAAGIIPCLEAHCWLQLHVREHSTDSFDCTTTKSP
jgi:2-oxoisovalerate dehydrogenase E1 component